MTIVQVDKENLSSQEYREDRLEIHYLNHNLNLPTNTVDGQDIISGLTQTPKSLREYILNIMSLPIHQVLSLVIRVSVNIL